MFRRYIQVVLMVVVLLTTSLPAGGAYDPIRIYINGQALSLDVPPAVVSGRTLVPLRAIFEALGAKVTWDADTQTASATWPDGNLQLPIGSTEVTVNGGTRTLDVPAQIVNNRTMVPLRFVAETLGAQVGWYGRSRLITINRPPAPLLPATVTRVTDGDTIEVQLADGRTEKVRLIGVDTPETVHPTKGVQPYGPEASAFTQERLSGQQVLLEHDVEERDRYGRLLAYVYLPNGTMFNAVLTDEGYAQIATYPPNVRYVEVFKALQADARAGSRGLWGLEGPQTTPSDPAAPSPDLPYDPNGPDRDCGDFRTQAEAQAFFEAAGGPARDPHRLDSDNDGVVCENLP